MKKYLFILLLINIGIVSVYAQTRQTEICIDFRVGSYHIDPNYMDNKVRLSEIIAFIEQLRHETSSSVSQLIVSGVSSPEGNYQTNRRLARERMLALESYIRSHLTMPDSLVLEQNDSYIPWNYLISQVQESDISYKADVLSILQSESRLVPYSNGSTIDSRIPALKQLDGGKVWQILNKRYFSQMRNACAVLLIQNHQSASVREPITPAVPDTLETKVTTPPHATVPSDTVSVSAKPDPEKWTRRIHLKTNTVGLAMLITNIGAEVDLAPRWSFNFPVYFSAFNYFTSKVKFRTLAFQPELRHWFSCEREGWFAGAHLGLGWFNYAKGDWRYQDHRRRTPLYGGGLNAGYRKPISKDGRWLLEFSLGGGIYHLNYDIFHNEPNGRLIGNRKRTFYGVDNAAVSFVYRFDLKKGGKE